MVVEIVKGDITEVKADVIVNAANTQLRNGAGVCGAIHAKAGEGLLFWASCFRARHGEVFVGDAVTSPSYDLPSADRIVHAVGPIYNPESDYNRILLELAYRNSLDRAMEIGAQSIAFPAISTGVYGYPMDKALEVVKEVVETTKYEGKIILVCYSDEDYIQYKKTIKPFNITISRLWGKLNGWPTY